MLPIRGANKFNKLLSFSNRHQRTRPMYEDLEFDPRVSQNKLLSFIFIATHGKMSY
jgi:hypothetical protein